VGELGGGAEIYEVGPVEKNHNILKSGGISERETPYHR
jgi:hypothetical protein